MEKIELQKIRNILISKLGLPNNYECGNYIGDHNVWEEKEFESNDIGDLENINISPEIFENIYDKYVDDIIKVIERNPYMKVYAIMDKGDMSEFNENTIKNEFKNFMAGNMKLNSRTKITLKTFVELLNTYDIEDLLNENETVRKELKNGVFDLVKNQPDALSKKDREKINKLDWNKEDVDNYYNLPLLYERFKNIKEKGNIDNSEMLNLCGLTKYLIENGVPTSEEKISFGKREKTKSKFYSRLMSNIYENYEIINRQDIVSSLYSSKGNMNIEKFDDIPDNMLLHYYDPKTAKLLKMHFTNVIINRERLKNGEEILPVENKNAKGKNIPIRHEIFEEKYKDKIKEANLDDCVNELKPDITFNITDEDIEKRLGTYRLDALKGTQLACTTKSKNQILETEYNVEFAVGFGNNIQPQNIMLACDRNADSNLGVENIPCKNKFKELSKTYDEIQTSTEERKEILLDRKNLKAEYLLCVYDREGIEQDKTWNEYYYELIENELEKAKELGLNVIMVDRTKIIEERQKNEIKNGEYCI